MAKLIDVAVDLIAPHLEAGESVTHAIRVSRKGTNQQTSAMAVGGLIGVALTHKKAQAGREQHQAAGLPDLQSMTLALTDRRLFCAKNSTLGNKPKEVVLQIPLGEIVATRYEAGKLVPKVFVTLSHGAEVELEAAKIDKPAEFVDALAARLSARAA